MINTFINARNLERAYKINSIIYWFKTLPIIGKRITNEVYDNGPIKVIANILHLFYLVTSFCISDILYILAIFGFSFFASFNDVNPAMVFNNILFFGAICGILLNSRLFDPSEDKYYGIILMRMNAKEYVLSDLIYFSIRKLIGYSFTLICILFLFSIPFTVKLAFIAIVFWGKYLGAYIKFLFVRKNKIGLNSTINLILVIGLVFAAFFTVFNEIAITNATVIIASLIISILGIVSLVLLFKIDYYDKLCKVFLNGDKLVEIKNAKNQQNNATEKNVKKSITLEKNDDLSTDKTSNATGYKYFNQIFVKRHSKLLRKRTQMTSIIIGSLSIGLCGTLFVLKLMGNEGITDAANLIFTMPFVMYFINSGETLASTMFFNCDSAMLTYNFFKKPGTILGLFKERLKTVIIYNIIPALFLSAGLSGVSLLSSDPTRIPDAIAYAIVCPALSIFFSVHRLVIYYLLQPFTVGQEKKKSSYTLINAATYFVAYFLMTAGNGLGIYAITFAIGTVVFAIIYVAIALLLVYKLAPKTFKLN